MVHRSKVPTLTLAAVAMTLAACGKSSSDNAAPRVSAVPQQSTSGDSAFSLDLGTYVTDREAATLTFAVTSGGGSFAGSLYTNTFDTMGDYTVAFTVTDGAKVTTSAFIVRVTEANFAVVREDNSGLLMFDTRTNASLRIAGSTSTPSFAAGLGNGRLLYQLAAPAGQQLWIHDPLTRVSARLAATATGDVTYRAKTSDGKVVYSAGTGDALSVYCFNPATGVAREISQNSLSTLTVLVNASDLVFYEVGVAGQADVYGYDPSTDETFAVGTATTDEQIQAVLENGACVFSRIGGGGEADLFYLRVGTGLVEIGLDNTAIETRNKTYHGAAAANRVVFSATNGSDNELFAWNPANGQTTTISSGDNDVFDGIGDGNEVVFHRIVSSTDHDVKFYDLDDARAADLYNGADIGTVVAITDNGSLGWVILTRTGATSSMLAVSMESSPSTQTWAAGGAVEGTVGTLRNGDVVAERTDGTALNLFDVSAGTWGTAITGAGLAFAGQGLADDDFVYSLTASSQTDLSMWDASAGSSVVVSDTVGNDVWQATTLDGTVLFTRIISGGTNSDLFVWNGSSETQLTTSDSAGLAHDHTVVGSYTGAR